MRELTQNEIVAVAGGWECTVGYPFSFSCTFSDEEIRPASMLSVIGHVTNSAGGAAPKAPTGPSTTNNIS